MKGYMYILECANGKYYTGSTKDLLRRFSEHQDGKGANFTSKHLPVKLVYYEEFDRIDKAFYREKQVQGWTRKKKDALIGKDIQTLHNLAVCGNETSALRLRSATEDATPEDATPEDSTPEDVTARGAATQDELAEVKGTGH